MRQLSARHMQDATREDDKLLVSTRVKRLIKKVSVAVSDDVNEVSLQCWTSKKLFLMFMNKKETLKSSDICYMHLAVFTFPRLHLVIKS